MADEQTITFSASELQASIDDLATRAVIDGVNADVPAALKMLSQSAQNVGYYETATEALLLANEFKNITAEEEAEMQAGLTRGLARLIEVLKRENFEVSKAAEEPEAPAAKTSEAIAPEAPVAALAKPAPPPAANPLASDPELVGDFVTESREHLTAIETQMLVLEENPEAKDAIHAVFRAFHTIKGLAGFLEFQAIQEVAHEVETLLDLARNEKVEVTTDLVDVVLESADYLKASIENVEAEVHGQTGKTLGDRKGLISRIRAVTKGTPVPKTEVAKPSALQTPAETKPAASESKPASIGVPTPAAVSETKPAGGAKPEGDNSRMGEAFTIRIETNKLDRLMDAVGELMVAQATIRHTLDSGAGQDSEVNGVLTRLTRITADVQRSAMSMRMVPVGQLFGRSARLVRDLSRKLGKKIRYEANGENTEVDKTIAEELSDPLLHMVRNAIDHGIEMPDVREAAGKDPMARVRLSAYHKGAEIVIEISDDGKGLDKERILAKAIEKGLVSENANLSESEIFALIFEPGFSTAAQVSDLSGRGVGMDVVRKNLAKLRGQIDIVSSPGKGSTFYLRLPLTLAIIEGLVVIVGNQRFIIPVFAVKEMVRVTPDMVSTFRGRHEMALIRGELLPIVRLSSRLGIKSKSTDLTQGLLVITENEGKQTGVWIDDLIGSQEVVIKSLGEGFKEVKGVSGCAILGDGRVGLILDMAAIGRGEQ